MSIDLMWQYFLSPEFIRGAWMTLLITLCSLLCGVVLGLVLALLQEAPFRAGKGLAFFYLWLFRGTPVLFQIIFVCKFHSPDTQSCFFLLRDFFF